MNHFLIHSKEGCTFCTKAKNLITSKGDTFTELVLNKDFTRDEFFVKFPEAKTFPIIELNRSGSQAPKYLGGYYYLLAFYNG